MIMGGTLLLIVAVPWRMVARVCRSLVKTIWRMMISWPTRWLQACWDFEEIVDLQDAKFTLHHNTDGTEQTLKEVVEEGAVTDEDGNIEHIPMDYLSWRKKRTFTRLLVDMAKNRFYDLSANDSPVMRQTVHKWCRDKMVEHKMRPSHISQILPLVVAYSFVPSRVELEAATTSIGPKARSVTGMFRTVRSGGTRWFQFKTWLSGVDSGLEPVIDA
jgi:hypothetical protein